MSELLDQWRTVADAFGTRLAAVQDDQWDDPTPCEDFTVRQLVDHAVDVQRLIPRGLGAHPDIDTPLGDDAGAAWGKIVAAADAALRTEGALDRVVPSMMGERPVHQSLGIITSDLLIHTWDLARAIGADEALPTEIVAHTFEKMEPMDAMLRQSGMFGPKVEVPADAPVQVKLIAFTGRTP